MRYIKTILTLFFIGFLFQLGFLSTEIESQQSINSKKLSQPDNSKDKDNKMEKSKSSEVKKEGDKLAENKNKKAVANKTANKKKKRQVASKIAYSCTEFGTDKFSPGYIQLGAKCSSDDNLCLSFFHVERNYCEGDYLIRYYCAPNQPSLFSTEKIKCKKSCEFSGLSGVCIK